MANHNSYYDGAVQSISFERNGRKLSTGVFEPGDYNFGTDDGPERVSVTSGELNARFDGETWKTYPAGSTFEVAGGVKFDVRIEATTSYLLEYL